MNRSMKRGALVALVGLGCLAGPGAGCLTRPVEHADPNLKSTFTAVVENTVIDKIDILFSIDNSASMGDKQDYLKAAIPDLVNRLITPNCLDATGASVGQSMNALCPTGSTIEFPPVHDLHLGIVSSALGPRLGDVCDPTRMAPAPFSTVLANNDDQAHLLNRSLTYANGMTTVSQGIVPDAQPGPQDQFLYWFPATGNASKTPGPGTPITNAVALNTAFADLVGGTGVFGCGIESQLESWYRFLIQPDPYQALVKSGAASPTAAWSGVDTVILSQRHDFLRPDSLVAVVVLSDENDSEIDVRSLAGQGWNWMLQAFTPPRGTAACATNLSDPNCKSCAQVNYNDPGCKGNGGGNYSASNDWGWDINLRHVHMKAKYGVDPQFPIQRYLNGLQSRTVPDRNGEYPPGASTYQGMNDCVNPLYAGKLPDGSKTDIASLCHLPPGTRTKDLVFFAHIGGVPYQLLHFKPGDPKASAITPADWVKILGANSIPPNYDYTGIDPHMIESYQPRANIAPPGSTNNADVENGHDWVTDTSNGMAGNSGGGHILAVDREYACIFPLADKDGHPAPRDCTQPQNQNFCDCPTKLGSLTAAELPPICNTTLITQQTGAKAYPTIRELELTKLMGDHGIVSSICPQHVADNAAHDDPLYGYRPAVASIIDRLKINLTNRCLPQRLEVQKDGSVQCLILATMNDAPPNGNGSCLNPICPSTLGLKVPDQAVLSKFCQDAESAYMNQVSAGGMPTDPAHQSVCELNQLTAQSNNGNDFKNGSCIASPEPGWCYVTGAAAGACAQEILFTHDEPPTGATTNLVCLEQSVNVLGDGG